MDFKIYKVSNGSGYIVEGSASRGQRSAPAPAVQFRVVDGADLLHLRRRLSVWMETLEVDGERGPGGTPAVASAGSSATGWLRTDDARRIARERGVEVGTSTLNAACQSGGIEGAHKGASGGRWEFTREAFEVWFAKFLEKKR